MNRRVLVLVVTLTAVLAAWQVGTTAAATFTVTTVGNSYSPADLTVAVGDTVNWTGITGAHTVSRTSSNWTINSGSDTSWVFSQPGTYTYTCNFHAMDGRVVVQGQQAATSTSTVTATSTPTAGPPTTTPTPAPAHVRGTLVATLSGANEVPAVAVSGTGSVSLTFDSGAGTITGSWHLQSPSSNVSAAHIHTGAAGSNGGILVTFAGLPAAGGSFTTSNTGVSASLIQQILANPGSFYVNVHTTNNTGGEVRGQLGMGTSCPSGQIVVLLASGNEVPARTTSAQGMVALTLDGTAGTVTGNWTIVGQASNAVAAHIHQNVPGVNGPIVVGFSPLPTAGGAFTTTTAPVNSALIANILQNPNGFYVNVHTADYADGEVRGQLACAGFRQHLPIGARTGAVSGGTVQVGAGMFAPRSVTARVGQLVRWYDEGGTHTVTSEAAGADGGPLFTSDRLAPNGLTVGMEFSHTFTAAGTYPYYCRFHGAPGGVGHAGSVIVTS